MLTSLAVTTARDSRPQRGPAYFALLAAVLAGPACHDTTAPGKSPAPVPSFTIVSGDAQTGPAGGELAGAIVARATDGTGTPISGVTVSFVVTQGGGHLYAGTGVTDANGNVQDYWTLGPGVGVNKVEVRSVDPTTGEKKSYATFTATATVGPAAIIKIAAGDAQTAFTRAVLPIKPAVLVTDAFGNPVAGVSVTFAVKSGSGYIAGTPATTNSNGIATLSTWRMGFAPGTNRLTATKTGLSGSPVTFSATAKFGLQLVATGGSSTCGLDAANDVYCWGYNQAGQLADGTRTDRPVPARIANPSLLPRSLAQGDSHGCLLLGTGKAYCWGAGGVGQLGNGTSGVGTLSTVPVAVRPISLQRSRRTCIPNESQSGNALHETIVARACRLSRA